MAKIIQSVKSFVAWEWIGHVTKSLFKLASYIVELPMVASGVYIMIATGIPGAGNAWWYNLAFGVLLSAPEVLAPGAFFRAETMEARWKLKVARVTRYIAGAMLFFAALTFSSVMIFHFQDEVMQGIMFCRVMTALGYSIITRIDMDHGATPAQPPALPSQPDIQQMIADLQADFQRQLTELAEKQNQALMAVPQVDTQAVIQAVVAELLPQIQAKFQAVDQELFRQKMIVSEVQSQAKLLPELRQTQVKSLPEKTAVQAKSSFRQPVQAEQNVIRLVPANASREELIAEAKRLRDNEGLSTYQIGEKLGKSAKTVQSWLSSGKNLPESEEREIAN